LRERPIRPARPNSLADKSAFAEDPPAAEKRAGCSGTGITEMELFERTWSSDDAGPVAHGAYSAQGRNSLATGHREPFPGEDLY
jgi:hypothetical protein